MNSAEGMRKEMPQLIEATGLSADYRNEYAALLTLLDVSGIEEVLRFQKEGQDMKKYEEHFPPFLYKNVITDKNREAVKRIDELADVFNEKVRGNTLTKEEFVTITSELELLIRGK